MSIGSVLPAGVQVASRFAPPAATQAPTQSVNLFAGCCDQMKFGVSETDRERFQQARQILIHLKGGNPALSILTLMNTMFEGADLTAAQKERIQEIFRHSLYQQFSQILETEELSIKLMNQEFTPEELAILNTVLNQSEGREFASLVLRVQKVMQDALTPACVDIFRQSLAAAQQL